MELKLELEWGVEWQLVCSLFPQWLGAPCRFLAKEKGEEIRTVAMAIETLGGRSLDAIAQESRGALAALTVQRLTIKTVCRDHLARLHADVEGGKFSPLAAVIYEEVLVNLESCGNHFKKAVSAYFGSPLRPDDDEITLNVEENT